MKNRAVLSLGTNLPTGAQILQEAFSLLVARFSEACISPIYQTPDCTHATAPAYTNGVVILTVSIPLEELNAQCKEMELYFGRTSEAKIQGVVPLDIDIVLWNQEVIRPQDYSQNYFKIGWEALQTL